MKHKFLSLINMIGLGVAMAAFLLILFYVHFETSFDNFHQDQDRIYRLIMSKQVDGALTERGPDTYPAMAPVLAERYPGIQAITRINYNSRGGILTSFEGIGGRVLRDDLATLFASASFFDVFDLELLSGNPVVLDKPFMAMLSEELAQSIFGDKNPVGESFREDDGRLYQITGVFKQWEGNSHLQFDLIKSYSSIGARHNSDLHETSWNWARMKTYVKLQPGIDAGAFETSISQVVNEHSPHTSERINETISIQPLSSIHLGSDFGDAGFFERSSTKVFGFFLIGLVILLIGWLNFVNLSIARGLDRTKEAGIQKILGAGKGQLAQHYFFEAIQVNLLAFIIGLSLFQLLNPSLKQMADMPATFSFPVQYWLWAIPALLLGSLVSGAYPALVLSRVNVLLAIKNKLSQSSLSLKGLRTGLTAVQFVISLVLAIIVSVVYQQVNHIRSVDLGTRTEGVLVVKEPRNFDYEAFSANPDLIKNEWRNLSGVAQVASSYAVPGGHIHAYEIKEVNQPDTRNVAIPEHTVDYDFLPLYELELVAGRNFSRQLATDDRAAILNEAAVRALGFASAEEALGKRLTSPEDEFIRHVVGVIKDYHQLSPAMPKQPILFGLDTESRGYYSIKYDTEELADLQARVEATFHRVFPDNVYHSFFLDDYFDEQYRADETLGRLLTIFALVAIVLSVMGLVSMTYFGMVRRLKELSIRKVLGADYRTLMRLLSGNGNLSFVVAVLVAIPLSFYLLSGWLSAYDTRISLGVGHFGIPVLVCYLVALLAMLLVMQKVLKQNPINALREE